MNQNLVSKEKKTIVAKDVLLRADMRANTPNPHIMANIWIGPMTSLMQWDWSHNYSSTAQFPKAWKNRYYSHHTSDCFPMSHKIHFHLPAIPLQDLSYRPWIIHGMCWYHVVTIWRPTKPQNMSCSTAISKWLWNKSLLLPIWCTPHP